MIYRAPTIRESVESSMPLEAVIRFHVLHADDDSVETFVRRNTITDVWKNHLRDAYMGDETDVEIHYMEYGDDNTTPAAGNTALGNAFYRQQVTSQTAGATGVVTTTTYVSPADANQQIEEVGWYGGPNATGAQGTGVLVARVLWSRLKDAEESHQVDREDTIG